MPVALSPLSTQKRTSNFAKLLSFCLFLLLFIYRSILNYVLHSLLPVVFINSGTPQITTNNICIMKKIIIPVFLTIAYFDAFAQQKDFEGILTYRIQVESKNELISNRALMNMMALTNSTTVMIKHGNYRQISGITDSYYITKDQRAYIKFKGVDTLYYLDYSDDTTSVTKVFKSTAKRNIAGFECNELTVQTGDNTRKYYYSPLLYMNPQYDENNKINRYDIFAKETSSLYLATTDEGNSYSISQTCTKITTSPVNDSVFSLPDLPRKKFSYEDLIVPPEFTRAGGWEKYLQNNLNTQIASKYVKIPKGEKTGSQQVLVRFMVNEYGKVVVADVVNKKEVHPKLAAEALRVVNESPLWRPATFFGAKIIYWMQAPITFMVSKE
jgi:hypothetical protein